MGPAIHALGSQSAGHTQSRPARPAPGRSPAGPAARHPRAPLLCHGHVTAISQGQRLNVTLSRHFTTDRAAPTCPPRLAACWPSSRSPGEPCGQPRVLWPSGDSRGTDSSPAGLRMSLSACPSPPVSTGPLFVPSLWFRPKTPAGGGADGSHPGGGVKALPSSAGRGHREDVLTRRALPRTKHCPGTAPAPAASGRLASAVCQRGWRATVIPMAPAARMLPHARDLGFGVAPAS